MIGLHYRVLARVVVHDAVTPQDDSLIGTTRTRAMRNASLVAVAATSPSPTRVRVAGNGGLWLAFVGYAAARALSLGGLLPSLRRSLTNR